MKTGRIILYRKKGYSNSSRYSAGIYIDDKHIGNIAGSEQQELELECGKHLLRVGQSLTSGGKSIRSGEIEIDVEANITMVYSFRPTYATYFIFIFPLFAYILRDFYKISDSLELLIYLSGILIAIYVVTFGRKNYFVFDSYEKQPC